MSCHQATKLRDFDDSSVRFAYPSDWTVSAKAVGGSSEATALGASQKYVIANRDWSTLVVIPFGSGESPPSGGLETLVDESRIDAQRKVGVEITPSAEVKRHPAELHHGPRTFPAVAEEFKLRSGGESMDFGITLGYIDLGCRWVQVDYALSKAHRARDEPIIEEMIRSLRCPER